MCGIAGILTPAPGARDLARAVQPAQAALGHRGPDGRGDWQSPSGHAAFAHARLAIFDPTPDGRQPMSIEGGRYTIVYNGAIYNFLELRRSLESAGVVFTTRTDTEVVVRLFAREGPACFSRLRGMFAFAIWDEATRSCVLARDRFGIKPLYFSTAGRELIFASELRALVATGLVSRDLDPDGVDGYFRTGSVPEPRTILKDIRCLPAAHFAQWANGQLTETRYWNLEFAPHEAADADVVSEVRAALENSVSAHLAGDVPVGLFLSGGVDSTTILALAGGADRPDLDTYSMTFPSLPDDEGPTARRTAEFFGARHHECPVDAATVRRAVPSFIRAMDQPSIDGLNTFVVARQAADHGAKAVMSGLGADELFGGYPTFHGVPQLASWHRRFAGLGGLAVGAGRLVESAWPGARGRRVGDLVQQPPGLDNAYRTYRGVFTRREAARLTAHLTGAQPRRDTPFSDAAGGDADGDAVTRMELTRYVRNQLLRDADTMSMACGLELRTPFLDHELVDLLVRVPAALRVEAGKGLMRRAMPELPDWVTSRHKQCFQFPFEEWLGGEWSDLPAEAAGRCRVPTDTWYRKWSVYVLESWMNLLRPMAHAQPR